MGECVAPVGWSEMARHIRSPSAAGKTNHLAQSNSTYFFVFGISSCELQISQLRATAVVFILI